MRSVLLTSSVLILILTALRFLLRGRVSPRLQYALWLIAAVRLLVPVNIGSLPVSVLNAVPEQVSSVYVEYTGSLGPVSPEPAPEGAAQGGRQAQSPRPSLRVSAGLPPEGSLPANTAVFSLSAILLPVWSVGMAGMALWFAAVNLAFRRRLRQTARPLDCPGCPLPVFVAEGIPSPCLAGLLRPAVYVTPACLEEGRLRHVLAHELTHWRHKDPLWSLVRCLCLCVHWFNPLVWLAASLSLRDCELACDEGALARLGEDQRTSYGRTLIGLIAASPSCLLRTATTMTDSKRSLKERLLFIARKPRARLRTAVAVLLLAAAASACTFTGAQAGPGQPDDTSPAVSPDDTSPAVSPDDTSPAVSPDGGAPDGSSPDGGAPDGSSPDDAAIQELAVYLRGQPKVLAQVTDADGARSYLVPPDVVERLAAGLTSSYRWFGLEPYDGTLSQLLTGPYASDWTFCLEAGDGAFSLFFPGQSDAVLYQGQDGRTLVYQAVPVQSGGLPAGSWARAQINEDPVEGWRFLTDDGLMYYLLNQADGAYAEGAQYELGDRFLARPDDILNTLTWFRGIDAVGFPSFQGDAADWLIHALVLEFRVMRGEEDAGLFDAVLSRFGEEDYGGMARDVREVWTSQAES